jgi:DNA-binding transcriptional MerR regulator
MVKPAVDQLFTIHQAGEQCGVPRSTLRFWERRFSPFLDPVRSPGGQRRYSKRHLDVIGRIKALKQQGLGLGAVYDVLRRGETAAADRSAAHVKLEELAARVAGAVKNEVYRFFSEEAEGGSLVSALMSSNENVAPGVGGSEGGAA